MKNLKNLSDLKNYLDFYPNLVLYFSADWCGPCKRIKNQVEQMTNEFKHFEFFLINVDEAAEITKRYSIISMPTFVIIKNKEEFSRSLGTNLENLKNKLI